ncbi:MAG: ribosome silencing factor [bacterium]
MSSSLDLPHKAIDILENNKGEDLLLLNMEEQLGITDYFLIATAQSQPHLSFLKKELTKKLKEECDRQPEHTEGESDQEWLLVDYGDVIIHLFTEKRREYYDLEGLWADAEVEPESSPVQEG